MELALTQVKDSPIIKSVAKHSAIILSSSGLYWLISSLTPQISNTLTMLGFDKTLRLANVMRGMVLEYPSMAVGTGMGAYLFNQSQGQPDFILPLVMGGLGLCFASISKGIGRGLLRDITLLSVFGAIGGFLVTMKKLSFMMLLMPATGTKFMSYLFTYKMWTTVAIYLAGYAIVRGYKLARK